MRVVLATDYAAPRGGAERQVALLRDGLAARGHQVMVLASTAEGGGELVDVACYGTAHPRWRVVVQTANPSAWWRLRRLVADFAPDVVHVRMFLTQLSPLILPLVRDVPSIYHAVFYKAVCPLGTKLLPTGAICHEPAGRACRRNGCLTPQTWALEMGQRALVRRWSASFDRVIAISETVARRLAETDLGPVEVRHNPAPARPLRPPLAEPPVVAFAGRLVPEKGPDVALRAFAAIAARHPGARLLVAGDGPLRGELATLAAHLGVADRVELPGALPPAELEARLEAAWAQVVPGRWEEPLGNVTLEGMARGTAMVVSDLGGPAELIDHDRTGLVVPAGDPGALADALDAVLADPDRAERYGRAAREAARRDHDEGAYLDWLEGVYAELAAAPAPGGSQP